MKRKFFRMVLCGALIFASTSAFVSCKDYDDDIDNLQGQITTNATTLQQSVTEKTGNVEKEIAALQSQQSNLQTAYAAADEALKATIATATNDAAGYADQQAAAAQKAAIEAAQSSINAAVASLQASLKDANAAIEKANSTAAQLAKDNESNISKNANSISGLLDADKILTTAVATAQARADKAYDLANQALTLAQTNQALITANQNATTENSSDIKNLLAKYTELSSSLKDVPSALNTISTTLASVNEKMNQMGTSITALQNQAAANTAAISANYAELQSLKASNEAALKSLNEKDTELKASIEANQKQITDVSEKLSEQLKSQIESNDTKAKAYADAALVAAKDYADKQIEAAKNSSAGDLGNAKEYAKSLYDVLDVKLTDVKSAYADADKLLQGQIDVIKDSLTKISARLDSKYASIQSDVTAKYNDLLSQMTTFSSQYKAASDKADASATAAQEALTKAQTAQAAAETAKADAETAKTAAETAKSEAQAAKEAAAAAGSSSSQAQAAAEAAQAKAESAASAAATAEQKASAAAAQAATVKSTADDAWDTAHANKLTFETFKNGEYTTFVNSINELNLSTVKADAEAAKAAIGNLNLAEMNTLTIANKTAIEKMNNRLDTINNRLSAIESSLANLITGIEVQQVGETSGMSINYGYAEVTATGVMEGTKEMIYFPAKNATGAEPLNKTDNKYRFDVDAGKIYLTINPNTINFSGQKLYLYNSQDGLSDFQLGKVEEDSTKTLQRANTYKNNGFYHVSVVKGSETANTYKDDNKYALCATYKTTAYSAKDKKNVETTHRVYSKYEIVLDAKVLPSATAADMSLKANNEGLTFAPKTIIALDPTLTMVSDKKVYAKYLTCTAAIDRNGAASPEAMKDMNKTLGFNKVLKVGDDNFENINVSTTYSGYTFTFKYSVWNYNGSIFSNDYNVILTNPLFTETNKDIISVVPTTSAISESAKQATNFANLSCMTDKNTIWVANTKTANFTEVPAGISKITFYDVNGANPQSVAVSSGTATLALTNQAKIKNLAVTYDPSQFKIGETKPFKVTFKDAKNLVVSSAEIEFVMNAPTDDDGRVKRISSAFNGDLTIAWAKENAGKAEYNMSGSFNDVSSLIDASGSYVCFRSTTTDGPTVSNPNPGETVLTVAHTSVQNETVYNMKAGVQYYGLTNLWTATDAFQVKFLSPIKYDPWTAKTLEVGYPGKVTVNDAIVVGSDDPSTHATDAINYFSARDSRVAKIEISFKDPTNADGNNGLFVAPDGLKNGGKVEVPTTGLELQTGKLVSLVGDTPVKFVLTITDVFGCTTTKNITIMVLRNK